MKYAPIVIGAILILAGIVWLLQGLNYLPGSVMSGQMFWAWAGLLCLIVGGGVIFLGTRGKRVP